MSAENKKQIEWLEYRERELQEEVRRYEAAVQGQPHPTDAIWRGWWDRKDALNRIQAELKRLRS